MRSRPPFFIPDSTFSISSGSTAAPEVIDRGKGSPVVLIPGIQGRWEWMKPTVDALARRCRVITFSLSGDPGSGMKADPGAGTDGFVAQIDRVLDRAGLERAALCGVSLGGLVALRYAAERPARVSALVLVSTPGPGWRPNAVQAFCVRHPWLAPPVFVAGAFVRLTPEVVRARGGWIAAARFAVMQLARVVAHPPSTRRMRQRYSTWLADVGREDCGRVRTPTLVLTGDRRLDRVVPADGSLEYVRCIANARAATVEDSGHIGLITRPDRFAEIVTGFVNDSVGC